MAKNEDEKDKKIIIDEDWKAQAQREKQVQAAEEKTEHEEDEAQKHHGPLPAADFTALIGMLSTQAFFALGLLGTPEDKDEKKEPDLELAKYHIDLLTALEEKTKGNLSEQEQQLLSNSLQQLRMVYVNIAG